MPTQTDPMVRIRRELYQELALEAQELHLRLATYIDQLLSGHMTRPVLDADAHSDEYGDSDYDAATAALAALQDAQGDKHASV